MAESLREKIVDDLVATLEKIDGSAPYQTRVGKVFRHDVGSGDDLGTGIFLGVFIRRHRVSQNQIKFTKALDFASELWVGVRAVIKTTAADAEETKTRLVSDLKRALYIDQRRGQNAPVMTPSIEFEEFSQPAATGGLAEFLATVYVSWLEDPGTP